MTIEKGDYLTDKIIDAILWVNTLFRGKVVICGSAGLVINDLLHRPIHDVDCITDENWYGSFFEAIGQYGLGTSSSEKFEVNGVLVCCFKLVAPNGVTVDVMYRADGTKSTSKMIYSGDTWGDVRVEDPKSCLEIKRNYLNLTRTPNPESYAKHKADLEYVEALLERRRVAATNKAIRDIEDDFQNALDF